MKIGVGAIVFALVVLAGGAGVYVYVNRQTEAAIDQAVERNLRESQLENLAGLLEKSDDPHAALRALYQQPRDNRQLNTGYKLIVAHWTRDLPRLQRRWVPSRKIDDALLEREIDERLGDGAFAIMREESVTYDRVQAEQRAREAQARARADEMMIAIQECLARGCRLPRGGFRVEDGKIVPLN